MSLSNVLRSRRKELGLTLAEIADKVGVSEATVQRWESGNIKNIRQERISKLAGVLHISPAELMGWETSSDIPKGFIPVPSTTRIPLVGTIACGVPILAEENVEGYVELPDNIRADFALRCKGDSMIGAGIRDGDIVYIRKTNEVPRNGRIAAVRIDDEATLKRFYLQGDTVRLVAENPAVPTLVFVGEEINSLAVEGLAVGYTHKIEG